MLAYNINFCYRKTIQNSVFNEGRYSKSIVSIFGWLSEILKSWVSQDIIQTLEKPSRIPLLVDEIPLTALKIPSII